MVKRKVAEPVAYGVWSAAKKQLQSKAPKPLVRRANKSRVTGLVRHDENPIIMPVPENGWEAWQTFNPGVILLDDKVHFLYRAIGEDGISRLGYAVSSDGLHIDDRLSYPVYEHNTTGSLYTVYSLASGGSWGGAEDPRIVRVDGESELYMTYTAVDGGLRVGLTSIGIDDFLHNNWHWKLPILISPPDEVHKNWMLFPEKINGKYAILHSIKPSIQIEYRNDLDFEEKPFIHSFHSGGPQKGSWDTWLRGAGAPPLRIPDGWLLFYHAIDGDWSKYKVGAMLLDLEDPTKILHKAKEPVLEPKEFYENNGYKSGVVYVSGAVVKNGTLFVYYGCADSYISVAYANLDEFVRALKTEARPKLTIKKLKKK